MPSKRYVGLAVVVLTLAWGTSIATAQAPRDDKQESGNQLTLKACGANDKEVGYTASTDKTTHPTPEPPPEMAMIYVLRPTMMGNGIQTKLAVDGEWKGVNRGNNYFFFPLRPGEHYVCSKAENRSVITINVEAGKTYYLQQHITMGVLKARNSVDVMKEDEAKGKLEKLNLATWKSK